MTTRRRILITDDDLTTSVILQTKLERFGYDIERVTSGEEALKRLQDVDQAAIDLILLDQSMGGMTGFDTFLQIREFGLNMPVIMVTAYSSLTLAVEFLKAGGEDYVEKPILDFDILDIKIQRGIEHAEARLALEEREAVELAYELKSKFLTRASHDMRSPFSGIATCIEAALITLDSPFLSAEGIKKVVHVLRTAHESAGHITKLLNDTLNLAKLEAGHFEYAFAQENLVRVISEAISNTSLSLEEKNLHSWFEGNSEEVSILIDPNAMKQVFSNLIENAIKFSDPNGNIRISLVQSDESVTVTVSDEGVGIPENETSSIFDRFAQSSRTRRNKEGTGLGLAICREIVVAHGGTIWAQNNPDGKGATLYVQIPKG